MNQYHSNLVINTKTFGGSPSAAHYLFLSWSSIATYLNSGCGWGPQVLCARLLVWWSDQLHPPPCACLQRMPSEVGSWILGIGVVCWVTLIQKVRVRRRKEGERERKGERIVGKGIFLIYLRYAQVRQHSSVVRGVVMWKGGGGWSFKEVRFNQIVSAWRTVVPAPANRKPASTSRSPSIFRAQ